jgi:hypothetical protein
MVGNGFVTFPRENQYMYSKVRQFTGTRRVKRTARRSRAAVLLAAAAGGLGDSPELEEHQAAADAPAAVTSPSCSLVLQRLLLRHAGPSSASASRASASAGASASAVHGG